MNISNTLFVGKVLHHFPRLASTNQYAMQLIESQSVIEGTVVFTNNQFAGKGQLDNQWESTPNKNIAMSIILSPTFLYPTQQFYLNIAVTLAVRETLASYTAKNVEIKWSNDILIAEKKISGILIQNTLSGQQIQSSIVGVGININQEAFSQSVEQATSLFLETRESFELEGVMNNLCKNLETYYLKLRQQKYLDLREEYFQHLFRFQKWAWYETLSGIPIKGKITDVLETGQLVVQHNNSIANYNFKEIRFLY